MFEEIMNYELAKQLKDAGFPQIFKEQSDSVFDTEEMTRKGKFERIEDKHYVLIPTLSELIEACPKKSDDGAFSLAYLQDKWFCGYEKYEMFRPECIGSTPEEAVARLYLALTASQNNETKEK